MIQFNLLPDVKIQFIKARRTRRMVVGISSVLTVASIFILIVLLGTVYIFQKKNLSDLNRDISTYSNQLTTTPDLNKILTVQNQLNVLTSLHDQKPVATRLFGYLQQLTPSDATISQFNIDFTQNTMTVTGSAKTLDIVNTFIDTLKFTNYSIAGSSTTQKAFSSVVLSQFDKTSTGATYTITLSFDPTIFNNANSVNLNVPNIISTRSVTEQPTDLFQSNSSSTTQGGH